MNAPIGLFDSGYGGLNILQEFAVSMPQYDYCYFGDNANAPYGDRRREEIFTLTSRAVEWLFAQGAPIVILACNTASAAALKRLQQEWLPQRFPDRKILGILIPVAQAVGARARVHDRIGIIATNATIASKALRRELTKYLPVTCDIIEQPCPPLVSIVEAGQTNNPSTHTVVQYYLNPLRDQLITSLVLGCTHYPLLMPHFRQILGNDIPIFHAGDVMGKSLGDYLARHPEIERRISRQGITICYTSGDPLLFASRAEAMLPSFLSFVDEVRPAFFLAS